MLTIQVNKFEQVSNDDHQMSVAGRVVYLRCDVWGGEVVVGTQVLRVGKAGTLPCTLSHHTYDVASPVTPLVLNRMTLPSRNFARHLKVCDYVIICWMDITIWYKIEALPPSCTFLYSLLSCDNFCTNKACKIC